VLPLLGHDGDDVEVGHEHQRLGGAAGADPGQRYSRSAVDDLALERLVETRIQPPTSAMKSRTAPTR
jgi:hypothetical protein